MHCRNNIAFPSRRNQDERKEIIDILNLINSLLSLKITDEIQQGAFIVFLQGIEFHAYSI
jgi:hypothetical protein